MSATTQKTLINQKNYFEGDDLIRCIKEETVFENGKEEHKEVVKYLAPSICRDPYLLGRTGFKIADPRIGEKLEEPVKEIIIRTMGEDLHEQEKQFNAKMIESEEPKQDEPELKASEASNNLEEKVTEPKKRGRKPGTKIKK